MPRSDNQKARILALYQILQRYSDESHGLTMAEILKRLESQYDIETTRQTVQSDFALLDYVLKIPIKESDKRPIEYTLAKREFSADDLLLLIDSVQAFPVIPLDRKRLLVEKLKTLCSIHEAKRISLKAAASEKTSNYDEGTWEKICLIERAIREENYIRATYPLCGFSKDVRLVKEEITYEIRPIEIYYSNGKAHLYGNYSVDDWWNPEHGIKKTGSFKIELLKCEDVYHYRFKRDRELPPDEVLLEQIPLKSVSLDKDRKEKVTLQCEKTSLAIVKEKFGAEIQADEIDDETYRVTVKTEITPEFLGWLFSMGTGVKLLSPLHATQRMKQWLREVSKMYGVAESHREDVGSSSKDV